LIPTNEKVSVVATSLVQYDTKVWRDSDKILANAFVMLHKLDKNTVAPKHNIAGAILLAITKIAY